MKTNITVVFSMMLVATVLGSETEAVKVPTEVQRAH